MSPRPISTVLLALWLTSGVSLLACPAAAQPSPLESSLRERIDRFVESERLASGIPGIALAVVQGGQAAHVRGYGHDGRGHPIDADTPFPIGSLTKSFTALLVRQAIDAGQLDADSPVQRYLPWFRAADAQASARITVRHLLNQSSGLSRADGVAPLLQGSRASIDELARGLARVALVGPPGERFEYSNLNFVLLGAVLQAVTSKSWQELVHAQVLEPLAMTRCFTDADAARQAGMTAVHRIWFGVPLAQQAALLPGLAPTGGLVCSASDLARYLQMLLDGGIAPAGRVLSGPGVAQLLAPASPPARSTLLATEFEFRYGEGWFVGPFGAARDARWHLGNLPSFAAWMVLLPETRQAAVVLINANTELPFNEANAVMSRLPMGVVNLLQGQAPPPGPSLPRAYLAFDVAALILTFAVAVLAWWAWHSRSASWSGALLLLAAALAVGLHVGGLGLGTVGAFAPDLAVVLAAVLALMCLPALLRASTAVRRSFAGKGNAGEA